MRPERLELPAYWFEAINKSTVSNLAVGTVIINGYADVLVIKYLRHVACFLLTLLGNGSIRGVGTKLGTLDGRKPKFTGSSSSCLLELSERWPH